MSDIEKRLTAIEDALQRAGIPLMAPVVVEPEVQIVPLEELPIAATAGNGTLFSDLGSHTKLLHTWVCKNSECSENYSEKIIPSTTSDGVTVRLQCRDCGAEYSSGRRFRDSIRAKAWQKAQETGKPFEECYRDEKVSAMFRR